MTLIYAWLAGLTLFWFFTFMHVLRANRHMSELLKILRYLRETEADFLSSLEKKGLKVHLTSVDKESIN